MNHLETKTTGNINGYSSEVLEGRRCIIKHDTGIWSDRKVSKGNRGRLSSVFRYLGMSNWIWCSITIDGESVNDFYWVRLVDIDIV